MIQLLRIMEPGGEIDPVRLELDRRLVATMMIMDHLVSGTLRLPLLISKQYAMPTIMNEDDFWALKRRTAGPIIADGLAIPNRILKLSSLLHATCAALWTAGDASRDALEPLSKELRCYRASQDPALHYTADNIARHLAKETIRPFLLLHLLYNHVGQILSFSSLQQAQTHSHRPARAATEISPGSVPPAESAMALQLRSYSFAHAVVDIVRYCLETDLDLHNFQVGQVLITATVVLSHEIHAGIAAVDGASPLSTVYLRSPGERVLSPAGNTLMAARMEASPQIRAIRDCITRSRQHTRMYNWVVSVHEACESSYSIVPPNNYT